MIEFLISLLVAVAVLYVAEFIMTKKLKSKPELSRKLVHIAHGLAAASWPFFLQRWTIIGIELLFLIAAILARRFRVFKSLDDVNRKTWGELLFPIGIIIVALLNPSDWIFAAAMLHLGLADSFAAIVGTAPGKHYRYHIFGHEKSIEGTLTFWAVSLVITLWVTLGVSAGLNDATLPIVLLLPLGAAILENIGVYGIDNLMVPIYVTVVLASQMV